MGEPNDPLCTLVADDLTGACDAAVQFAIFGCSTSVLLDWPSIGECRCDVVAATTDSRADAPDDAAAKVVTLARLLHGRRGGIVFKKIDSALRGNPGAEIEAARQAFDCEVCVVAPSFPAQGRCISGGWLKTAGGGGPAVHLPTLLEAQGVAAVSHVDRTWADQGIENLAARLEHEVASAMNVLTFDAVSDSDLDAAIAAASLLRRRILWVGSAGLARRLAGQTAQRSGQHNYRQARPRSPVDSPKGILLAIGSDHPATLAQMNSLAGRGGIVTAHPVSADLPRTVDSLRLGRAVILRVEPGPGSAAELRGFLDRLDLQKIRGFVLSGGDTASLVCAALHANSIRMEGEISDGFPWGTVGGGPAHGVPVATKSGGFGQADALIRAVDFLCGCERVPEA